METARIDSILSSIEDAIASGGRIDLSGLGFWKTVRAAKTDPAIRDSYAERIAAIDQDAFGRWALIRVPLRIGTLLMLTATAVALGIVGAAYYAPDPWNGLLLLAGTAALLVTTHGLGHLAVGAAFGIRFTHWFIGSILRPQPGVKIEYSSYLAAPASRRAWMHASGALVTKTVPFLMLGAAWGMGAPAWAWGILVAVGVITIVTDILWSGGASDWKRFSRERRIADAGY